MPLLASLVLAISTPASTPASTDGEWGMPTGRITKTSVDRLQATDGNFYGTTENDGTHNIGTLFKLTSTGTLTSLYSFGTCVYPCKEGGYPKTPPVEATDGNYYGTVGNTTDGTNNGVVYKLTSAGKFSTIYAFDGTLGFNPQAPLIQGADGNR